MSNENILDKPIPDIKGNLLLPTKAYLIFRLKNRPTRGWGYKLQPAEKIRQENQRFDQSNIKRRRGRPTKLEAEFYKQQKQERLNSWMERFDSETWKLFNQLQKKPELKFELNKEALKVTKRYELDCGKTGLSLNNPLSVLEKTKPLTIKKFKKYSSTKQQLSLVCLMKKTNPATGKEETDISHFHSKY